MNTNETRDIFDGLDTVKLDETTKLLEGLLIGKTTIEKIQLLSELLNDTDIFALFPELLINKAEFGEINNIELTNKMLVSIYLNILTAYRFGNLLETTAVQNYNNAATAYSKVQVELSKLKKNLAAFDIYNKTRTGAKMHLESFINQNTLDFGFPVDKTRLALDTDAGILTLPRDGEISNFVVPIDNVRISDVSNGSLGTSVSLDGMLHDNMKDLFDGAQTTWTEYERVSPVPFVDPLVFEVTIGLKAQTIVNELSMVCHPVNGQYPLIDDISVSSNGIIFESVFENNELKRWLDSPSNNVVRENDQGVYSVYFMPQKIKFIRVKLKQEKQYIAVNAASERIYRQAIAVKEIVPFSIKYKDSGEIVTKKIETNGNYNAIGLYSNDIFFNEKFGSIEYNVSKDDGQNWTQITPIDEASDVVDEIIPFDNLSSQLRTKIKLTRTSTGFTNTASNTKSGLITYVQSANLPTTSPFSIVLDQAPADNNIFMGIIGIGAVGKSNNFYVDKNTKTQKRLFNVSSTTDVPRTLYTSYSRGGTITLPLPSDGAVKVGTLVSEEFITVATVANGTEYTKGDEFKFNSTNNSIFFVNGPGRSGKFTQNTSIKIDYFEVVSGIVAEYAVELPYPFIAKKQGKYLIHVDGTLFTEVPYSALMTAENQYKIRYGTNEVLFNSNISGQILKIVIDDEIPVFSKSAPHAHSLEVSGNGITSELSAVELLNVEAGSITSIPVGSTIFQFPEKNIIPSSFTWLSSVGYRFDEDTNIIAFDTALTSTLSISYKYIKTRSINAVYSDSLFNTVTIPNSQFSSYLYQGTATIDNGVVVSKINIDSAGTYEITPSILEGTVSVISGAIPVPQVPFVDGVYEFRNATTSQKMCSIDFKNGKFYFKNTIGNVSIQYNYTKYRLSYGFSIQIDPKLYSLQNSKNLVLNESFVSKTVSLSDNRARTVTIRYNIKQEPQATLAELEPYYSPYLFDFSLIFGR